MSDVLAPACVEMAKAGDEAEILDLLRLKHEEDTGSPGFPLTANRNFVRNGVAGQNGCIGIIRGARRIEASIGLFVGNWCGQITSDEHLYDRWLFVHPNHRRTDHGKHLIDFARYVAEHCGRAWLSTHIINSRTAAKSVLYERALGGAFAFVYLHDPNGVLTIRDDSSPASTSKARGGDIDRMSNNAARRLVAAGTATGVLDRKRRRA